jgi:VWFA-related protein
VQIAQPLTSDQELLEQAIRRATPRGLTALYQAIYVGLREMAKWRREDNEIRRQAAIVLSDGDDTSSIHVAFDDVLAEARRGAVAVFTIFPGLANPVPIVSARAHLEHASFDLKMLSEDTGGRSFRPTHLEELSRAYGQISEELAQQYWLGYVPPPHSSGGFKQVSVRIVNRPELRTRTRRGYEASDPHLRTTSSGATEGQR